MFLDWIGFAWFASLLCLMLVSSCMTCLIDVCSVFCSPVFGLLWLPFVCERIAFVCVRIGFVCVRIHFVCVRIGFLLGICGFLFRDLFKTPFVCVRIGFVCVRIAFVCVRIGSVLSLVCDCLVFISTWGCLVSWFGISFTNASMVAAVLSVYLSLLSNSCFFNLIVFVFIDSRSLMYSLLCSSCNLSRIVLFSNSHNTGNLMSF